MSFNHAGPIVASNKPPAAASPHLPDGRTVWTTVWPLAFALLAALPTALHAQCGSPVDGTQGNPLPLSIGTEADCALNSLPVPGTTTQHLSNVTPLGCGATQQRDIWFTFTATSAETVLNLYNNSTSNTGFMVYRGPCGTAMDLVGCAGYTGVIAAFSVVRGAFPTVPGDTYHVRVSRAGSNTLGASLRLCGWASVPQADHPTCEASFESGTTQGWTCRYGSRTNGAITFPHTGCLNPNGMDAPLLNGNGATGAWNAGDRHTVMSDKVYRDPRTFGEVSAIAPRGGNYSFRLGMNMNGSANPGGKASSVSYDLPVTPQNAGFTFMFAAVMQNPGHNANSQPIFEALVIDPDGNVLDCGYHLFVAGSPLVPFYTGPGNWQYTRWTEVGLDLTAFIGRTVTIEFRTGNCAPAPHMSYAYVDTYCKPLGALDPVEFCAGVDSVEICAPAGYANYRWPAGQPGLTPPLDQRCVTIANPLAGTFYTVEMELITGCPTNITVELRSIPVVTTGDTTVCAGDDVDLLVRVDGGIYPPYTFQWGHGPNGPGPHRVNPTTSTAYTVTTTNGVGCTSVDTITVHVAPCPPTVTVDNDTICLGGCADLLATANPGSSGGPLTYRWQPDIGNTAGPIRVCPTQTTQYIVTVTNPFGESASDTSTVTVGTISIPVTTSRDTTVCPGQPVDILVSMDNPVDPPYTFQWDPGGFTGPGPHRVEPVTTTTYVVTTTNASGCFSTSSVTVAMDTCPPTVVLADDTICSGQCLELLANVTYSGPAPTIRWLPDIGSTAGPLRTCPDTTTTYTVTVIDALGNSATATATVTVLPKLAAAFSMSPPSPQSPGTTVAFTDLSTPMPIATWDWTFGTGAGSSFQHPAYTYTSPGNYPVTLRVTNELGCVDSTTQVYTIKPDPIRIPNVFSPNNDGRNDRFHIENLEFYRNTLTIFSRWGNVVFEATDYRNSWAALDVTDGTYYYVLHLTEEGETHTGHVTIVR